VAVIKVQCDEGTLDDDGDFLAYQLDLSLNKFLEDTGSQEFIWIRSKNLGEGF
jgi:hypothetical protein